jgi:hypothetical protein
MRIGLAKQLGIATSKIRFLSRDLVYSSRLPNRHRDYDQESLLGLQTVLLAQSFGFPLEEINIAFLEIQGRSLRCDYIVQAPGKDPATGSAHTDLPFSHPWILEFLVCIDDYRLRREGRFMGSYELVMSRIYWDAIVTKRKMRSWQHLLEGR